MNDWTIIITFIYPHEAHLAKGFLEAEGFEVMIKDELTAQVNNFYSTAIGGVKLLVPEQDAKRARETLKEAGYIKEKEDETRLQTFPAGYSRKCPYCQSEEIIKKKAPGYVVLFSILLLGLPLPFLKKNYYCFDCHKEWKVNKRDRRSKQGKRGAWGRGWMFYKILIPQIKVFLYCRHSVLHPTRHRLPFQVMIEELEHPFLEVYTVCHLHRPVNLPRIVEHPHRLLQAF